MKREDLLIQRLNRNSQTGCYPFHMPGHKRQLKTEWIREFPNPFSVDITEIEGFDNLHHAEGILKESMEWAASVYGADHTFYLVNGSSCGILSAICGTACVGGRILMSRNCHKAAYHGAYLQQLQTEYLYPQVIEELGIQGGILPEDVEKYLKEQEDIQAVLIVSPTYDGIVSDISAIAEIVHRYGIPLIVDEAHGAHFSFGNGVRPEHSLETDFPKSALELGADLVIQSVHKTLPSLTQTAVLHVRDGLVDLERIKQYLSIFQTSSPSYLFMAGIEECIWYMDGEGRKQLEHFGERLKQVRTELSLMKRLKLAGAELSGSKGVYTVDPSKIVVSSKGSGISGAELMQRMREIYGLELEMCGADYVVAITTLMDEEEGLQRLVQAFLAEDTRLASETEGFSAAGSSSFSGTDPAAAGFPIPVVAVTVFQGISEARKTVELKDSAGLISGEFIYLYPPGIPIVAPGEILTDQVVEQVLRYQKMDLPVQGMKDPSGKTIKVVSMKDFK